MLKLGLWPVQRRRGPAGKQGPQGPAGPQGAGKDRRRQAARTGRTAGPRADGTGTAPDA